MKLILLFDSVLGITSVFELQETENSVILIDDLDAINFAKFREDFLDVVLRDLREIQHRLDIFIFV